MWYILKSTQKFGPFDIDEMIHMMQTKTLFDFDFVWTTGMKSWSPMAEIKEFSKESLEKYFEEKKLSNTFIQRKHSRVEFKAPLFVHNNSTLWTGRTMSLSEGGALVIMTNPLLVPGNIVNINFKKVKSDDISFNASAEIISKKFTRERLHYDTPIQYSIKFVRKEISAEIQLKKWINEKSKNYSTITKEAV
jgi:hypothetical protein